MSKRRIVFVLGAGASRPFGFPMGNQLLIDIYKQSLDTPGQPYGQIYSLLRDAGFDSQLVSAFRDALYYSSQPSVDAFLENRREYVEVGKAAIAAALIPYENKASLRSDWYEYLFWLIAPTLEAFLGSNLSIVTFNYDRSLEQFLYSALRYSFGLSEEAVTEPLQALPIIHVHGLLGGLPYSADGRPYDTVVSPETVRLAASGIRIIHEVNGRGPEFDRAHELIRVATNVCFLGFGYHKANVDRLRINELRDGGLMGTAFGLHAAELTRAQSLFTSPLNSGPSGVDVLAFLRHYPLFH